MKLRRGEKLAILFTVAFLMVTAIHHVRVPSRTPEFRVITESEMELPLLPSAAPEATEGQGGTEAQAVFAPSPVPGEIGGAARINLNTASLEELRDLDGVGEVLAERIITYRETNGPFSEVDDITKVSGIGTGILEANRDRLTVAEEEETS